jgi:hypothetical protein
LPWKLPTDESEVRLAETVAESVQILERLFLSELRGYELTLEIPFARGNEKLSGFLLGIDREDREKSLGGQGAAFLSRPGPAGDDRSEDGDRSGEIAFLHYGHQRPRAAQSSQRQRSRLTWRSSLFSFALQPQQWPAM